MKIKTTHEETRSFPRKLLILCIIFSATLSLSLNAQDKFRVSLSGGLNDNDITYNTSNRVDTEYVGESGNYFKAGFAFKVYKNLHIQTGLMYLNKNYRYQRTGYYEGIYTNYNTRYFNVPVMLGIKPFYESLKNTRFNFEIMGGAYAGWWNTLERDGVVQTFPELDFEVGFPKKEFKESYDFDKNINKFNRVDYGLIAETRFAFRIYKQFDLFAEYSFMYGLSDNQKEEIRKPSRYYYTTSNYGIGVSYNF